MIFILLGFSMVALVVLLAFRWFPKFSTMVALLYGMFVVAFAQSQLGDFWCEVLLFVLLGFLVGLPIYWIDQRHRRARGEFS